MISKQEAHRLYEENWCLDYSTMDELSQHIQSKAQLGHYEAFIYIDSVTTYNEVKATLRKLDYNVEDYNGGGNGILEISW